MLSEIQHKIKAPKNLKNTFGDYKYRSAEKILEAAKPVLSEYNCSVILSDEVVEVGGRIYVKATANLIGEQGIIATTTAFAREQLSKKGSDEAQITGAASSYARKYALNGLFAIDDTSDPDTMDNTAEGPVERINNCQTMEELRHEFDTLYKAATDPALKKEITKAKDIKKAALAELSNVA